MISWIRNIRTERQKRNTHCHWKPVEWELMVWLSGDLWEAFLSVCVFEHLRIAIASFAIRHKCGSSQVHIKPVLTVLKVSVGERKVQEKNVILRKEKTVWRRYSQGCVQRTSWLFWTRRSQCRLSTCPRVSSLWENKTSIQSHNPLSKCQWKELPAKKNTTKRIEKHKVMWPRHRRFWSKQYSCFNTHIFSLLSFCPSRSL